MELNKKILNYIKEKDIIQSDLSKKLGYTQANLSRILNSNDIKFSQLEKICDALSLPVLHFIDNSNSDLISELEGYKKRIKELELAAAQSRFYKFEKFFNEAKNMLEYGYSTLSPVIKEKILEELFEGVNNYRQLTDDILANMMLDLSTITKKEIREGIDELVKKHSNPG